MTQHKYKLEPVDYVVALLELPKDTEVRIYNSSFDRYAFRRKYPDVDCHNILMDVRGFISLDGEYIGTHCWTSEPFYKMSSMCGDSSTPLEVRKAIKKVFGV